MRWHPLINALAAAAYIALVAKFIAYMSSLRHDTPDTMLDSMGFLSLLVTSAAVMGFLFFYRPVMLLIENKKEEAISFFLTTLGTFAAIAVLFLTLASMQ